METPDRRTILVIQNTNASPMRRLAEWWQEDDVAYDLVEAYTTDLPDNLSRYQGLVLLGGAYLPDDDAAAPWLPKERQLATAAMQGNIPTLGICLGAQLIAHATGGVVREELSFAEHGVTRVRFHDNAIGDPLFAGFPEEVLAFERHKDAIVTLPSESVLLASSDRCPHQVIRFGPMAWGTQFHPEVPLDSDELDRKVDGDTSGDAGTSGDPDELDQSAQLWRELTRRFAALVAAEPRAPRHQRP